MPRYNIYVQTISIKPDQACRTNTYKSENLICSTQYTHCCELIQLVPECDAFCEEAMVFHVGQIRKCNTVVRGSMDIQGMANGASARKTRDS